MTVVSATWEAKAGASKVQDQPRQLSCRTHLSRMCKALGSIFSIGGRGVIFLFLFACFKAFYYLVCIWCVEVKG